MKLEDALANLDDSEIAKLLEKRKRSRGSGKTRVHVFDVPNGELKKFLGVGDDDEPDDDDDDEPDDDDDDEVDDGAKKPRRKTAKRKGWFD